MALMESIPLNRAWTRRKGRRMTESNTASTETGSPDEVTTEGTPHLELDGILKNWILVGSLAWEGFVTQGLGHVLIAVDEDGVHPSYVAGSPCACCPIKADTYDPETQAVVVIRWGEEQRAPFIVSGVPTPPETLARADADIMGGTVH
jgi:hypothetical protein